MTDIDVVVIGTGFGGSVSALRFAEKGYRVVMLEMGERKTLADLDAGGEKTSKLFWMPKLGQKGYFAQNIFQHMAILRSIGVGGGSLVYAAVHLRPKQNFYNDKAWKHLSPDWEAELKPHYDTAEKMLGVVKNPYSGIQDDWLKQSAEKQGISNFDGVTQAIYFGTPEQVDKDPFFNGEGPERTGCTQCGRCMTGCAVGAKNTLDLNYLYFAKKKGVEIRTLHQVTHIEPHPEGGYWVHSKNPFDASVSNTSIHTKKVVLAAGVLGTLEIMFASKQVYKTLPNISNTLGEKIRTNSEAFVGILAPKGSDVTHGAGISSHYYPNETTHVTQNRSSPSWWFMRLYMGPLVDGTAPIKRVFKTLWHMFIHPIQLIKGFIAQDWYKRITILTVMQQADNELKFSYGRTLFNGGQRGLRSHVSVGTRAPSYIAEANNAARAFAEVCGGQPFNMLSESLGQVAATAHILGGAYMADRIENGVIDVKHEVFGYPELYVMDGSVIPANVGVNPSLTITALAERFNSFFPTKK